MPTASEELRNEWHNKHVWIKLDPDLDRKSLGATAIWFDWAWMPMGEVAASQFLRKQEYHSRRGVWYRPRWSNRFPKWEPTKKEKSALAYLCEEWDESYDLRHYSKVIDAEHYATIRRIAEAAWNKDLNKADQALREFIKFRDRFR